MTLLQLTRKLTANKGHLTRELIRVTKKSERFENNNCKRLSKVLRDLEGLIRDSKLWQRFMNKLLNSMIQRRVRTNSPRKLMMWKLPAKEPST